MATRNKIFIPNEIYFITFTILGWKNVFINDKYCNLVYKWFDYVKNNYGDKVHGYVIMPNHLHLLLFISDKSPIMSKFIQNTKRFMAYEIINNLEADNEADLLGYFKQYARTKEGAKHKVFKDNYDSLLIQSNKLFLQKLNYIHNNPCQLKWRLADEPENYKYSSAANYILDRGIYGIEMVDF